jgi:hypothetical protein
MAETRHFAKRLNDAGGARSKKRLCESCGMTKGRITCSRCYALVCDRCFTDGKCRDCATPSVQEASHD